MKQLINSAIERRLEEIGRERINRTVKEKLIEDVMSRMVTSDIIDEYVNDFSYDSVRDYLNNIRTFTITIEVSEKDIRTEWNIEHPNMALDVIVKEELLWSIPSSIEVTEVLESNNPLYPVIYGLVQQSATAIGAELNKEQVDSVTRNFIGHEGVWSDIDNTLLELIEEVR